MHFINLTEIQLPQENNLISLIHKACTRIVYRPQVNKINQFGNQLHSRRNLIFLTARTKTLNLLQVYS